MLKGKVAVVTGAGRGVGRSVAIGLARAGARVVVNDLGVEIDGTAASQGPASEVADEIRAFGGEAIPSFDSVATMDGGRRIIDLAMSTWGRVDTVACAAGILRPASIFDMTEAEWDDVIAANLKGIFTVVQPAARVMRDQQSGSIITFTSTGGLEGNPKQPNYSATKEGLLGITRAVALTLAPYATCNSISPSAKTRMSDLMLPAGRVNPSADLVAPLAVFLASDRARHITGQVIAIGGDRLALYPQPRPTRIAFMPGGWTAEALADRWDEVMGVDKMVRFDRYVQAAAGKA